MSGPFNYIPFGDEPGQLYPLASQDTYASQGAALSVVGSGGGGGGGGTVPANLAVSSLTIVGVGNNTTNDIILQANGTADVRGFPAVTWVNLNRLSSAFSTLSLDIQNMNPAVIPPGAPDRSGAAQYCCPTFELNGPNGPTTCPIAASAILLGFDTNQTGVPVIYTAADSVSSLNLAATSSIAFNTPSFVAPPNTTGISSINSVSWQYIISTLAAVK